MVVSGVARPGGCRGCNTPPIIENFSFFDQLTGRKINIQGRRRGRTPPTFRSDDRRWPINSWIKTVRGRFLRKQFLQTQFSWNFEKFSLRESSFSNNFSIRLLLLVFKIIYISIYEVTLSKRKACISFKWMIIFPMERLKHSRLWRLSIKKEDIFAVVTLKNEFSFDWSLNFSNQTLKYCSEKLPPSAACSSATDTELISLTCDENRW